VIFAIDLGLLDSWFEQSFHLRPFCFLVTINLQEDPHENSNWDELNTLLASVGKPWLKQLIVFGVNTGLRRGEMINLRWDQIDFERKVVLVCNLDFFQTKTKSEREIPLNASAEGALRMLPKVSDYVFVGEKGGKLGDYYLSQCFRKAIDEAKLNKDLTLHSLRHSFGTLLVRAGVSIYDISKLMGHSSVAVTHIYAHLSSAELHDALAAEGWE
jgi:integrase